MTYITVKQHRKPTQISFEDVFFGTVKESKWNGESDKTATVTRCVENVPQEFLDKIDVNRMIDWFENFNERHKNLFEVERDSLYRHYKIPKKTGGWRPIDEPCKELQDALGELADFLQEDCSILYHTAAFAYIKDRSTIDAVRKHVNFKSNWYVKTDVSGFFNSTEENFTYNMVEMVFPLSEVAKVPRGKAALEQALSLGFLNGGLPQGTKLSPFLTNVLMIPIDHRLFGEFARKAMVYTRYADDMHISAKENFPYKMAVELIEKTFREFGAPYKIKPEKTHYGSVRGKNWMLGLMANGNYDITVGWRAKKYAKAMICNFVLDTKNGKPWDLGEVAHLKGLLSYYESVEKKYFRELIQKANKKWNVDVDKMFDSYLLLR